MFSASTSQHTLFGIVHTFVNGLGVTNQLHQRWTFLRREMAMWLKRYKDNPHFDRSQHPHIPDILTADGLKDIMAIGNLLELATVVDRRYYQGSPPGIKERVEMGTARSMYRQLQCVLSTTYTIRVNGKPIPPLLVFRRSLVELAAALVVYKEAMDGAFGHSHPITADKVKGKVISFFKDNYPNLLPRLHVLIKSRQELLYWSGPELSIVQRTDQHRFFSQNRKNTAAMKMNRPLRDFIDAPLYPVVVSNNSGRLTMPPSGSDHQQPPAVQSAPDSMGNNATTFTSINKDAGLLAETHTDPLASNLPSSSDDPMNADVDNSSSALGRHPTDNARGGKDVESQNNGDILVSQSSCQRS
jgi:hypothetical protein